MLCNRTVSLTSFVIAAAVAGQAPTLLAQEKAARRTPPGAMISVRDVIKPNPHDGALAAPVLSDTWWIRVGAGQQRVVQPGGADGAGIRDADPAGKPQ
ncbi:hypothetical protein J5277_21250 [Rhizobium sp. 16-449-1b]|uniref:hypothetical protein n=1 Tax=Rhizobium sp. 16-449-1b TaxID=2819989 RepID=UPI001ADB672E|nr:hypothetical protein [Rhizobium sp. 16-449-1b]MBO9196638.1 hypothetical protein [Rhizobium sp. 16-449-1b]